MYCNFTRSLVWVTTMPSFSHAPPVCWPLCTSCSRRMLGGHGVQKKTRLPHCKVQFNIIKCVKPLQSCNEIVSWLWCISVRSRCHLVTQDGGWVYKANHLYQPFAESCWEKVLPAWQRRFSNRFWGYDVPSQPLWENVYTTCSNH